MNKKIANKTTGLVDYKVLRKTVHRTLIMGTEMVPETSVSSCNQLTPLCALEDFIEFSLRESFKLYTSSVLLYP
jgi:hypothetical protein